MLHAIVVYVSPYDVVRQAAVCREGDGQGHHGLMGPSPDGFEQEPRNRHPRHYAHPQAGRLLFLLASQETPACPDDSKSFHGRFFILIPSQQIQ